MKRFFTSESVTEGHPDKICDRISDAVLDEILSHDPNARVACETCTTTGMVLVMGEITTHADYIDISRIARRVLRDIGYTDSDYGIDCDACAVMSTIDEQSPDIAMGVDRDGAGDQGMVFGYACNETETLMPMPIYYAHELAKKLAAVRKDGTLPYLRPDGKTQVTVEYDDGKPVRIDAVVVSAQHDPSVSQKTIARDVTEKVIGAVIPAELMDENTKFYINPTGQFIVGGPHGDSGLTGRKIIVDTYGGYACHGGGAFSGKDPTKVDRSAAYMARYIAKNIVAAGIADKCQIQIAYAIGVAEPVSVCVQTEGSRLGYTDEQIADAVRKVFDMRPKAIIETLGLRRPGYEKLAAYGHFGREDLSVAWEKTDKKEEILAALGA
ncbi:MAG: methionine adenosyltransferase [Eubacteriales bacterium]|nr:methionine adenosyltransferase [Eubacteriales bacterium]